MKYCVFLFKKLKWIFYITFIHIFTYKRNFKIFILIKFNVNTIETYIYVLSEMFKKLIDSNETTIILYW